MGLEVELWLCEGHRGYRGSARGALGAGLTELRPGGASVVGFLVHLPQWASALCTSPPLVGRTPLPKSPVAPSVSQAPPLCWCPPGACCSVSLRNLVHVPGMGCVTTHISISGSWAGCTTTCSPVSDHSATNPCGTDLLPVPPGFPSSRSPSPGAGCGLWSLLSLDPHWPTRQRMLLSTPLSIPPSCSQPEEALCLPRPNHVQLLPGSPACSVDWSGEMPG